MMIDLDPKPNPTKPKVLKKRGWRAWKGEGWRGGGAGGAGGLFGGSSGPGSSGGSSGFLVWNDFLLSALTVLWPKIEVPFRMYKNEAASGHGLRR